jgi:glutathione peroxidase-family protein
MAVSKRIFNLCKSYFTPNIKIAELGAQYVTEEEWGGYGPPYFKDIFPELDLTSFDITGENNSICLNLSEPISDKYKDKFDLVTNFGTTEHVQNQFICWKNIFEMTKHGGIVISEIPKKDNWEGHCKYYFDEISFSSLKKDFTIIDIQDVNYNNGDLIYCVLKKTNMKLFNTKEIDFLNNITIIEDYNDNQGH